MIIRRLVPLAIAAISIFWALPAGAIEVLCHRGANEVAPENTYAAAEKCIEWGADYVEIDVRTSADGVMYILHDYTVNRTTSGRGAMKRMTAEEIDRLDAGSWFGEEFAGERVPRLEEYLRWIKGKAKVYFDIKEADVAEVVEMVYATGLENDSIFYFQNDEWAKEFKALAPELPLKVNAYSVEEIGPAQEELGAEIVEVLLEGFTEEYEEEARRRGLKIMVYHPEKDAEGFEEIIRRGADMVNLNHADLFYEVQQRMEQAGEMSGEIPGGG